MAEKRVSVRLAATGGRQVRAELEGVGEAGKRGFGRLSQEMEAANRRLAGFARRVRGSRILRYYRWRWFIECMFSDAKTKGLNLEDTRMTLAERLSVLVGILAIAIAMACHSASKLMGSKYPARKKHGYCSKSWFRSPHVRRLLSAERVSG